MDGWTDGGKVGWDEWRKKKGYLFTAHRLALSLIGALISRTPALNGGAAERNTAAANSYHDFCSN